MKQHLHEVLGRIGWLGLVALGVGASAPAWANPEDALNKAGCMACHAKDKKVIGPAFKDIAAKYKGQDVMATLMQKVRAGGKGVYGPIPMPPNGADKIADVDLKAAIEFILQR
jgi:cytochrome c